MKKENKAPEAKEEKTSNITSEELKEKAPAELVNPVQEAKSLEKNVTKVGSLLKEMRLRKGYKTVDIAKKLCIRRLYLDAIEEGNYEEIPEFPYGIGFIRSYADYLGLNSSDIIQLYKEETQMAQSSKNMYVLEPQAEATMPSKKYLLISLLALLLVYVLWFIYSESQSTDEMPAVAEVSSSAELSDLPLVVEDYTVNAENQADRTSPATLPLIDATAPLSVDTQQVVVTNEAFDTAPAVVEVAKPVVEKTDSRVVVKVQRDTWVEVKDGTKLYISKVLNAGESYNVPAGNGMILSVGKTEGVEVFVDGKLTPVVSNNKKMGIALDGFLNQANH